MYRDPVAIDFRSETVSQRKRGGEPEKNTSYIDFPSHSFNSMSTLKLGALLVRYDHRFLLPLSVLQAHCSNDTSLNRTLAKPVANSIKVQAKQHASFREFCISVAQVLFLSNKYVMEVLYLRL